MASRHLSKVNGFRQGAKIRARCDHQHGDQGPWEQTKTVAGYDQGELVRFAKEHAAENPEHAVTVVWEYTITYIRPAPRRRR